MDDASTHMYRTLLRVTDISADGDLTVVIPARGESEPVVVPSQVLPEGLVQAVRTPPSLKDCTVHLYARVNLNAEDDADLRYSAPWELRKSRIFNERMHINEDGQITDYGVDRLYSNTWQ